MILDRCPWRTCALLGIRTAGTLNTHFVRGALLGNTVVTEVLKNRLNRGLPPELYFWRDKTGHEVDLLVDDPEEPCVIEVKGSRPVHGSMLDGFTYHRALNKRGARYLLLHEGSASWDREGIEVRNWTSLFRN